MKSFLLLLTFFFIVLIAEAQVSQLPVGKYETLIKDKSAKWEKGDIIIIDDSRYKVSGSAETGEYKFSVTAQRVFFTSGPLKSLFARTVQSNNAPAILFPASENEQIGFKMSGADVWGYYRN